MQPSEETVSRAEYEALKRQVTTLLATCGDLQEQLSAHVPPNTTINGPHPILSIDTGEFGGGIMRLDANGVQIAAPTAGTYQGAIYWVPALAVDPETIYPRVDLSAYAPASGDPSFQLIAREANNVNAGVLAQITDLGGGDLRALAYLVAQANASVYGYAILRADDFTNDVWFELQRAFLRLASQTADPNVPNDGDVWYRSDTDQYKGSRAGVVKNFLMTGDAGSLLTDTAWAAAGDLVYGTGNDTATILSHPGSAGLVLTSTTGPNAISWAAAAGGSFSYGKAITTSQGQNLP